MSGTGAAIECRRCGEVNQEGTIECARCGQTLLPDDELRARRAQVEEWKREAERESVDYTTTANLLLDRFSGNSAGKTKYFGTISNHRKRIGLACVALAALVFVLLVVTTGR
jgi:uncharacterized Zn finger protein (UPF0148 family)